MHGCPFTVAALLLRPADFPDGILDVFLANGIGGAHADLFAVVHQRRRACGEKQSGHQLGNLVVVDAVPVTIPLARLIMIAEKIVGLPAGRVPVDFIEQLAEIRGGEFVDVGNLKIHRQLDLIVLLPVHLGELDDIRLVGFAD